MTPYDSTTLPEDDPLSDGYILFEEPEYGTFTGWRRIQPIPETVKHLIPSQCQQIGEL